MRTVSSKDTGVRALPSAPGKVRVPLDKDLHGSRQTVHVPLVRDGRYRQVDRTLTQLAVGPLLGDRACFSVGQA